MPTNYSDTNHLTPTTAEAIEEQVKDIAEAASHLTILAEIDFEREENRADKQAGVDGCKGCGMAYSFFFNTQFHKEDCTEKKV